MAWVERYCSSLVPYNSGTGTIGDPWDLYKASVTVAPGDRVNVKADGTYTTPGSWAVNGTDTQGIWIRGYGETPGDGVRCYCTAFQHFSGTCTTIENFDVEVVGDTTDSVRLGNWTTGPVGARITMRNVKATSSDMVFSWQAACGFLSEGCVAIDCEFESTYTTNGYAAVRIGGYGNSGTLIGCRLKASGGIPCVYDRSLTESNIIDCIMIGDGGAGGIEQNTSASRSLRYVGNTFYNCTDGVSVYPVDYSYTNCQLIANNLFHNCTNGIVGKTSSITTGFACINNAFYNITTAQYVGIHDAYQIGGVTCSVDPCIDAANGDLRLNDLAGGGADVRAAALTAPALL